MNPESLIIQTNGVWGLTPNGLSLQAWWMAGTQGTQAPPSTPAAQIIIDLGIAQKSMEVLRQASMIVMGSGTVSAKVASLKTLLAKPIT